MRLIFHFNSFMNSQNYTILLLIYTYSFLIMELNLIIYYVTMKQCKREGFLEISNETMKTECTSR